MKIHQRAFRTQTRYKSTIYKLLIKKISYLSTMNLRRTFNIVECIQLVNTGRLRTHIDIFAEKMLREQHQNSPFIRLNDSCNSTIPQ